jgi:hypothetical protein
MPQASGMFNTAPTPIPGGGSNPAGMNIGIPGISPQGFPPALGPVPKMLTSGSQAIAPSLFPANGAVDNSLAGLSSGFNMDPKFSNNLFKEFRRAYGKGTGDLLFNMMTKGLFNPQVAQALISAMQPARARGLNDIQNMFGDAGARFSSAAAIGAGDFESQFALGENQILAQLFQHAQDQELGILTNTLPTLHKEEANQGGGFFSKLLPILETAAGAALEFVPGGQGLGTALLGGGLGGLGIGGKGGSGGGESGSSGDIASQIGALIHGGSGGNLGDIQSTGPIDDSTLQSIIFGQSAANALGGSGVGLYGE